MSNAIGNKLFSASLLAIALTGCASHSASTLARQQLAPEGKLVVGIFNTPVFGVKDARSGAVTGLVPDLGRALAASLAVEFEPLMFSSLPALLECGQRGPCGVIYIANDPQRAEQFSFAPLLVTLENSYLVRGDSPLRVVKDVPGSGARIAVFDKSVVDQFLSTSLQGVAFHRFSAGLPRYDALKAGEVDAVADSRHVLSYNVDRVPGSRVLQGTFMNSNYTFAIAKGRPAATAYLADFGARIRQDGTVDAAIRNAKLHATVAGP